MKFFSKTLLSSILTLACFTALNAQLAFDPSVSVNYATKTVILPPSPLKYQVLFVGGIDITQATATYGNPARPVPAKQWHDFIGVTPDAANPNEFWVSVNHEMIEKNPNIGDGGGMTSFKVRRNTATDTLEVIEQTLNDGRKGKFFNVDFVNTVGETGMNCGGISAPDGRIWTAEEWGQTSNKNMATGLTDTADFVIGATSAGPTAFPALNGKSIKKYQNFNWMVEIDPKQAKAIRKQYNWGRLEFEGGAIAPDNRTVYLGVDATPAYIYKFVADVAGDFTKGKLYAYKHDGTPKWNELKNTELSDLLSIAKQALDFKSTTFNRIEWVAIDKTTGKVYFTETGRDKPGSAWAAAHTAGAVNAPHHIALATEQGTNPDASNYTDYYGRVLELDPATDVVKVKIEGGPKFITQDSVPANVYPAKHLSNPDGLSFMYIKNKRYMIVQEDLNGTNYGRMPGKGAKTVGEVWLLDMDKANPTVNDLTRVSVTPAGSEVTGAVMSPDNKTMLINVQHPDAGNPFPYNNSLTYAITGWDKLVSSIDDPKFDGKSFQIFPNPVSRELFLSEVSDIAIYDINGKRIRVARNVQSVDVSDLTAGIYFVQNAKGEMQKLIVE